MVSCSKLSSLHLHVGVECAEAVGSTGEGCGSDCIAASLQNLVIPIRRPDLRGQPFLTRDRITPYNLAMKYTLSVACDLIGRTQEVCLCVCALTHKKDTCRQNTDSKQILHIPVETFFLCTT